MDSTHDEGGLRELSTALIHAVPSDLDWGSPRPNRGGKGVPVRRMTTAIAVAALALLLCGCTPDDGPSRVPNAESQPQADSPLLAQGSRDEHIEAEAPEPSPTHDAESDAEALTVASAALTAYLQRDLPQRTWLEGLEHHLTPAAIVALSSVDPASIPAVSGPGAPGPEQLVLVRDASGYLARVTAETGAGIYLLVLVRQGSAPWLVSEIVPPEERSA